MVQRAIIGNDARRDADVRHERTPALRQRRHAIERGRVCIAEQVAHVLNRNRCHDRRSVHDRSIGKPHARDAALRVFDPRHGDAVGDLTTGAPYRAGQRHRNPRDAIGKMKRAFTRDVERRRAVGEIRRGRVGLRRDEQLRIDEGTQPRVIARRKE